MDKTTFKEGFLYSVWSGELRVREGKVVIGNPFRETYTFISKDAVSVTCSNHPGEVYNAMVWLEERDDQKAKELLIDYYQNKIDDLKEVIQGHQNKINLLKGDEGNGCN